MGVRRYKHGQSEICTVKSGGRGREVNWAARDDRPLPSRVRGCHCEVKEMRWRTEECSSVQTHPSVPPGADSILPPFLSLAAT